MSKHNARITIIAAMATAFLLATSVLDMIAIHAATPYHVTLSLSNFSLQTLSASADDLSDPSHAMFSLQNGTQFWYGITVQSTPPGIVPTPASSSDLVTSTFYGSIPLLPPIGVLPFDQANKTFHVETLKLTTAFSAPNQQMQLDLNPLESHAITLDMFTLMLHLLGEKNPGVQIGLLAPGALKGLFDASSTLQDFSNLTAAYTQVLQAAPDTTAMLTHAYDFAKALVSMLTDESEQKVLSDILWKLLGKTIAYNTVLKAVTSFATVQFGIGMEKFIRDELLLIGSSLIQQTDPTVLLQSIADTLSPSPSVTQNTAAPTSTSPISNPTPTPIPTHKPTPKPTPRPTHRPNPTPTKAP